MTNGSTHGSAHSRGGLVALGIALVCFASVPLFIKYFVRFLDAWTVNGVRYAVAALFWLPAVLAQRRAAPPGRSIWRDALVPAAVNTLGQIGWALAPYHNDAAVVSFVIRSSFLFTIIFGFWLLRDERHLARRPLFWAGAAAVLAGVAAMYGGGLRGGGTSPVGATILLATAVFWGMYAVAVRKYLAGYGARLSFGVTSLYTTAVLLVLMFAFGRWQDVARLAPGTIAVILVSGLVGIAFAHVAYYRAIHALGPVVTDGSSMLQPFLATLGAMLLLGERLRPLQWLGGVLLACGCLALVGARRRPARGP